MAGTSLLALLDDIATILDDVAVLSKVAAKKTAGVLGDDLALNAEQVAGVRADRELPVVWAVAKGSLINKAILVPALLAISALLPWLVMPLLMLGGAYLCFEGFEKLAHKFLHSRVEDKTHHKAHLEAISDPQIDMVEFEKAKVKGAIRTDFILSAEILVITLGTVTAAAFGTQVAVLITMALLMTVGVYGLVAAIVKLDDGGLHLSRASGESTAARLQRAIGRGVLRLAPLIMKGLSIAGTAAMFLVGGGILLHGVPGLHERIEALAQGWGFIGEMLGPLLIDGLAGIVAGAIVLALVTPVKRLRAA